MKLLDYSIISLEMSLSLSELGALLKVVKCLYIISFPQHRI